MGNDPFAEGREAFDCGRSEESNPYSPEHDDFLSWNDGYAQAKNDAQD